MAHEKADAFAVELADRGVETWENLHECLMLGLAALGEIERVLNKPGYLRAVPQEFHVLDPAGRPVTGQFAEALRTACMLVQLARAGQEPWERQCEAVRAQHMNGVDHA